MNEITIQVVDGGFILTTTEVIPDRRVFYVDVGNLPPQRVKEYIEQVKLKVEQSADVLYLPVTADGRSTKVEILPGQVNEKQEIFSTIGKLLKAVKAALEVEKSPVTGTITDNLAD